MGGPTDPVLCWAFLVRRAGDPLRRDLGHFDAAVDRIRREHPELRIHYTGPLPAYHFFDLVAPIPIG
jgi:hypothetical protein